MDGEVMDGEVMDGEVTVVDVVKEGRVVPGDGQADRRRTDGRVRLDKPENCS